MRPFYEIFLLILLLPFLAVSQKPGCTDNQAINYDSLSTINNGSCIYGRTFFSLPNTVDLPSALHELSGMVYWNGYFWGHNDSGNGPWLYAFDTTSGVVRKVIGLQGASNIDWEDITQDSTHFFIGDFGNNSNGDRTGYQIYKVPKWLMDGEKDTVMLDSAQYSIIQFTYADQTDYHPTGPNKTKFDCEAMFYDDGMLHLVTKNWIGDYAVHYTLPVARGIQIAARVDSIHTSGFLITAADKIYDDVIILTAYNPSGSCRLYLVYGFKNETEYFTWGNKRVIDIPAANITGQLEAICFLGNRYIAIGSERFRFSAFDVLQNFRKFSIRQWINDH